MLGVPHGACPNMLIMGSFSKCAINGKMCTFWHLWLSWDGSKAQNTWDRISPQSSFFIESQM